MGDYLGDYNYQQTVYYMKNAHKADGTPIDGAGGLAVSVYKDDVADESTAGITLVGPFDSRTGLINLKIVTTDAFYAANHDYFVVVTTGTVDSISAVSYVLASFSIENRSGLRPTVAGRTLDVAATGEAGMDLTNKLDTVGILPSAQAGAASGLAIVGSSMEVATKTGFSLSQSFPANFASLIISALGKVTVGTNDDKTGYALTSALSAQNVWEYATRTLTAAGAIDWSETFLNSVGVGIQDVLVCAYSDAARTEPPVTSDETDVNGLVTLYFQTAGTYHFRATKLGKVNDEWTEAVT
jgi:hypothetical protein